MMAPLKVSLSTIAAQRRGSVKVLVQPTERRIACEGDGRPFFPGRDDLEQKLGAVGIELDVGDLIEAAATAPLVDFLRCRILAASS